MTTIRVRCGDCGQRVVEVVQAGDPMVEERYIRCPDTSAPWATCGNDPLTAERRDGPRWAEALRGAGAMRTRAAGDWGVLILAQERAWGDERERGIPSSVDISHYDRVLA